MTRFKIWNLWTGSINIIHDPKNPWDNQHSILPEPINAVLFVELFAHFKREYYSNPRQSDFWEHFCSAKEIYIDWHHVVWAYNRSVPPTDIYSDP